MKGNTGELIVHLTRYCNKIPQLSAERISDIAEGVAKKTKSLQNLAIASCNKGLTTRQRSREKKLMKELLDLLHEVNPDIDVIFGSDPRGSVVKILFPLRNGERPYNTWGGMKEGFGVLV